MPAARQGSDAPDAAAREQSVRDQRKRCPAPLRGCLVSREVPSKRSDFKRFRRFTTRWADNDAYGHVNHVVYYEWFGSAEKGWVGREGLPEPKKGVGSAVVVER